MTCVRDSLWLWAQETGSHNGKYGIVGHSQMSPAEGASYLGVPNVIMTTIEDRPRPPFDAHARALGPLKRVIWSIVGDSRSKRTDHEEVVRLVERFPNIVGAIMDDFFTKPGGKGARYTPDEVAGFRRCLDGAGRPLDLWMVVYSHQLDMPVAGYVKMCDGVTFWTWRAKDLRNLEAHFQRLEATAPNLRKMLGCYMWDYGGKGPMPTELLARQCEIGLQWLQEGRIEGMIFVASCICDLGLEAVEWTKSWVEQVPPTPPQIMS